MGIDFDTKHAELIHTIGHMYCRGYSVYDISRVIGEPLDAIIAYLEEIRSVWRTSAIIDFNERISYELKKLDYLETMYWEAWEKSKTEAETMYSEEEIEGESGAQRKRSKKTTSTPPGDPRFLDGIRWCIERRCELLGLDAPKKSAVLTASVDVKSVYEELDSEERQKELAALIKSLSTGQSTINEVKDAEHVSVED